MEGDRTSCAIFVLHRTVEIRCRDFETSRITNAKTALFRAFLGGDEHYAVAATRSVKSCCRGTFQNVEALDVLLVDVVQGRTPVTSTAPFRNTSFVRHRHTVNNDERLVVAEDAVITTNGNTRRATVNTVGVNDLYACRATTQGTDDAPRARLGNHFATDFLSGITQFALLTLNAESSNHHIVKHLGVGLQSHVDFCLAFDGNFICFITDETKHQRCIAVSVDAIVAVKIGHGTLLASFHLNGDSRKPRTVVA